ncbi:ABC transporter ATP-binding protein [Rhizobium sp. CFBP 8762]|uniref:ABC transporter ATP-binding protein n=1 Tax=Rhizobium sp. CFBP 8762 TaxID=2775279 RepID=UPI001781A33B|nr:ABC transporter ATP-binding protein [Rhizobium sp. CFBP 8762]MBD8554174.1 ABC transporter ATP-binding protein [Rhizobium sp. CFBP 8762]
MSDLTLSSVKLCYAGLADPVLDISKLRLDAGSHIAITGASGSGKSSLVNIISGLERASDGKVLWDDVDLCTLSETARERWRAANIGLVLQDFYLFSGLSALENVLLPVRLGRVRFRVEHRKRAEHLLKRVGLARADQPVQTMSRGEMQRVAVARALVTKPKILIADEPTASLDEASGLAVGDLLIELAREEAATLLVVSHDAQLVSRMERRIRLSRGKITETATPEYAA